MEKHKRRCVSYVADEDIISNLPEDFINQILERLPIKDAARTSILSKKWRYRWTTMRTLILDSRFSKQFLKIQSYGRNGFIRTTSQIMICHTGPILKLVLHIPKDINLDNFQEVDQWMLILSRNNVTILNIMNSNRIYQVPSTIFSCQELRRLILQNCIFKAPLECHGFPSLEYVFLKEVDFGGNLGGIVINLPQLKRLTLDSCVNVNNFNIKAEKLRNLRVINCPDAMLLRLLHSKSLSMVRISLKQSITYNPRVERFNLAMMLSKLPKIAYFSIDGHILKFLSAEKLPKWLPDNKVKCLKRLEFRRISFGDLDQVQGAISVLQNSPNLKKLCVTHMQMGPEADWELTFSYLDSPDCLPKLFKLQTVELTYVQGSRPEMLFIKLLLNHSPRLENMIIRPRATADAGKKLDIAKDIMMFPRASKKAKVVYLGS